MSEKFGIAVLRLSQKTRAHFIGLGKVGRDLEPVTSAFTTATGYELMPQLCAPSHLCTQIHASRGDGQKHPGELFFFVV